MTPVSRLFRDSISGCVVSLVSISFYVSCAALLFQGQLASKLSTGIGISLAGGAILALVSAFRSSVALSSVGPEPATVPILAGMTGAIAAACTPQAALSTAVVGLAIAALAIGLSWFLMGFYRVGDLIRFIPYPVIGGFLAAVGWLMFSGGLGVVIGEPFTMGALLKLLTHAPSAPLVAGIAVTAVIWWSSQRTKNVLLMPGLILFSSLAIYGWFAIQGMDVAAARSQGWLMPHFALALPVIPWTPEVLSAVDWRVLAGQAGVIGSAVVVSAIALLLSDSSLEVAFDEQADFNLDLKSLGLGNLALGIIGGLAGGISISRSLLNREAGAVTRRAGVVKAVVCIAAMLVGGPLLALIPKAVLGGLLMFMGIGMLKNWLVDGRKRLARSDYAVVVTIVLLTIAVGYLPAVLAGVVVCCFDFAVSSAKLDAVRRSFTRNEWPGSVERGAPEIHALREFGERLQIVELQGTLFFGSTRKLVADLEALMEREGVPLEMLVIDFRRVVGMDSSAAQALTRLLKAAMRAKVRLAYCGVSDFLAKVMRANGCLPPGGPTLYPDIAQAVVTWEDEKLAGVSQANLQPLPVWLAHEMESPQQAQVLLERLHRLQLEAGQVLFEQGAPADSLYWVEEGRLSVNLVHDGREYPVRTIQAGASVGEMGLYRSATRSATVRAEVPSRVLCMTQSLMSEIERDSPAIAIGLHRLFVRMLASRLEHSNANARAQAA